MSEIKDRPDSATGPREVWERKSDGKLYVASWSAMGSLKCARIDVEGGGERMASDRIAIDCYRKITIPKEPWPAELRVEKRRVVIVGRGATYCEVDYRWKPPNVSMDEIRDCELDAEGMVVRVLPLEGRE